MFIESLAATNFRNFTSLRVDFCRGVNVLAGVNGSGKTNLLEAFFVLCLGRSQRGVSDGILVRSGADFYRLQGTAVTSNGRVQLAVAWQRSMRRKCTVGCVPVRAVELFDRFSIVASGPQDCEILAGAPAARRLFLDVYLSQLSVQYLSELTDYKRALRQKNVALKNEMETSAFNSLLISHGSRVMRARQRFISELEHTAAKCHAQISSGEELSVRYDPQVAIGSESTEAGIVEEAFRIALEESSSRERAACTALIGPHRDDIMFTIGGLPARTHGSQGQWRTAAVSLKLAVYELLKKGKSTTPILLLDEIFAELDPHRCQQLMRLFEGADQIFLTTASDSQLPIPGEGRRYRIAASGIEEIR